MIEKFEKNTDPRVGISAPDGGLGERPTLDVFGHPVQWPFNRFRVPGYENHYVAIPSGPLSVDLKTEIEAALKGMSIPPTPNNSESAVQDGPAPEPAPDVAAPESPSEFVADSLDENTVKMSKRLSRS